MKFHNFEQNSSGEKRKKFEVVKNGYMSFVAKSVMISKSVAGESAAKLVVAK